MYVSCERELDVGGMQGTPMASHLHPMLRAAPNSEWGQDKTQLLPLPDASLRREVLYSMVDYDLNSCRGSVCLATIGDPRPDRGQFRAKGGERRTGTTGRRQQGMKSNTLRKTVKSGQCLLRACRDRYRRFHEVQSQRPPSSHHRRHSNTARRLRFQPVIHRYRRNSSGHLEWAREVDASYLVIQMQGVLGLLEEGWAAGTRVAEMIKVVGLVGVCLSGFGLAMLVDGRRLSVCVRLSGLALAVLVNGRRLGVGVRLSGLGLAVLVDRRRLGVGVRLSGLSLAVLVDRRRLSVFVRLGGLGVTRRRGGGLLSLSVRLSGLGLTVLVDGRRLSVFMRLSGFGGLGGLGIAVLRGGGLLSVSVGLSGLSIAGLRSGGLLGVFVRLGGLGVARRRGGGLLGVSVRLSGLSVAGLRGAGLLLLRNRFATVPCQ